MWSLGLTVLQKFWKGKASNHVLHRVSRLGRPCEWFHDARVIEMVATKRPNAARNAQNVLVFETFLKTRRQKKKPMLHSDSAHLHFDFVTKVFRKERHKQTETVKSKKPFSQLKTQHCVEKKSENENNAILTLAATPRSTCSHSDDDLYLAHHPSPFGW